MDPVLARISGKRHYRAAFHQWRQQLQGSQRRRVWVYDKWLLLPEGERDEGRRVPGESRGAASLLHVPHLTLIALYIFRALLSRDEHQLLLARDGSCERTRLQPPAPKLPKELDVANRLSTGGGSRSLSAPSKNEHSRFPPVRPMEDLQKLTKRKILFKLGDLTVEAAWSMS